MTGESNSAGWQEGKNFIETSVPTTTLDAYITKYPEYQPDLIKIDTEATEHYILRHGINTLKEFRPIVICEILFNQIERELEEIFLPLDYFFFTHQDGGLKQVETIVRTEDDGITNCFFVPKEKVSLIQEFKV